ncbi:MAG: type II secretion system protein [Candidatus Gastranaerophilaceae bacterium]
MMYHNKRFAFTLAEVLITLGIIGVVAAMTMPSLIQDYKEKQTVSHLLKAYALMDQSYRLMLSEYGNPRDFGVTSTVAEASKQLYDAWAPFLPVAKMCGNQNLGCMYAKSTNVANIDGNSFTYSLYSSDQVQKMLLNNGDAIVIWGSSKNTCVKDTDYCGNVFYLFDSVKRQSLIGKTGFTFFYTPSGIVPAGKEDDSSSITRFPDYCTINFKAVGADRNGLGCTAWVLHNKNMDYLHCEGLSWDGKNKCD